MNFQRHYPTLDQDNYPSLDKNHQSYEVVHELIEYSNYYIILKQYFETGIKGDFLTFQRNFYDSNCVKNLRLTSSPAPKQSPDNPTKHHSPRLDYSNNSNYRNILLSHYFSKIPKKINYVVFREQLEFFMKNPQISLATIRGFSFVDNNSNYFPIALTECPSEYSMKSYFSQFPPNYTNDETGQNIDHKLPISNEMKFNMIIKLLNGIEFINQNYVHSNLNPTTVYLKNNLEPVICDYFLAPLLTGVFSEEDDDEDCSTYQIDEETASIIYHDKVYVAPEILEGKPFDSKADIYSFGKIIYFILAGEDPKSGEEFKFPDNFPREWQEIIEKCTKINPTERPTIEEILDKFSDKEDVLKFISSIEPESRITEISLKTELSLIKAKNFNKEKTFSIFREMIPNVNELSEDVIDIISMAEKGDINSIEKVANFLYTGENNFYRDYEYAFECYKHAADEGSPHSIIKVSEMYEKGEGTDKRMDLAIDYYLKAICLLNDKSLSEIKTIIEEIQTKIDSKSEYELIKIIEAKLSEIKTKFDLKSELEKTKRKLNRNRNRNKKQIEEIERKIKKTIKIEEINQKLDEIRRIIESKNSTKKEPETKIHTKLAKIDENINQIKKAIDKINYINNKYGYLIVSNITPNITQDILKKFNPKSITETEDKKVKIIFNNIEDTKKAKEELTKNGCTIQQFYYEEVKTHRYDSLTEKNKAPRIELKDGTYEICKINKEEESNNEGSIGEAYVVNEVDKEEKLVAKIYKKSLKSKEINCFKREIIMASKLKNHPAIVDYVGFNEYSLKNYIEGKNIQTIQPTLFMEYIVNGDLEKAIRTKPEYLTDTVKMKIMIGIASALSKMHKNQIIHCDLKPTNILLDSNYEPVICDLGSSRQILNNANVELKSSFPLDINTYNDFTRLVDTNIFMPPEMFQTDIDPIYGSAVDIYDFGIVMYQIIKLVKSEEVYKFDMTEKDMELSYSYLINVRKSENIIPKLNINETFDTLIKNCWNAIIDERPTADEIYNIFVDSIEKQEKLLPNQENNLIKDYIRRLNHEEQ